ncbi:MAG: hypothetical protein LC754_01595 [Acidobacteria bacterium]|nr:hypothetical protein [Acidobacteriota bacterium]
MTKVNDGKLAGRTSRRQFAKSVAAALVAAPIASSMTSAQTPSSKEPKAPPNPQPTPTPAPSSSAPPKPSPVVEAYAEVARVRFGERLTPEEFERVKRDLDGNVRAAERLRAIKLKNSDEPDFIFSA